MLSDIAAQGSQVLTVSHSPEIVRAFQIEDIIILPALSTSGTARVLRNELTAPVRQAYERRLDGPVVRGLFARVPLLVEGPGDRAVFEVFWSALARAEELRPSAELGVDIINAEGAPLMPMLAAVLHQAGKHVVAWCERDTPAVNTIVDKLRAEQHCGTLILYSATPGLQKLEGALAHSCSLNALVKGMDRIASDRSYTWEQQRSDLVSRCEELSAEARERVKVTDSLSNFLSAIPEEQARRLCAAALAGSQVAPFEIKGARQGRLLAEAIVESQGVPAPFAVALQSFQTWILAGCSVGPEITMGDA
jgi:putative ATP-dependent endonuclease of OLD family